MTREVEGSDRLLVALRTAHRAVRDLLDLDEFREWVGPNTEVEQTVSELRTARLTLQELRLGRAFELTAADGQAPSRRRANRGEMESEALAASE